MRCAGEMGDDLPPVDVGTGRTVRAFDVGGHTVCVQLDDDTVKCWGLWTGAGKDPGTMGDDLAPIVTRADLGLPEE